MLKRRRFAHRFRIGEKEKEIIKMIGIGALVLGSFVLPNLPMVLAPFLKKRGKADFQKKIISLKEKGIIYLSGEKIKLSKKGQKILKEIEILDDGIIHSKKWDGTWHLVAYDVPDDFKRSRDFLRDYLKKLGFYQIQKSLWVFPFKCKEEIAIIADNLYITRYVIIMTTNSLPHEKKLIKIFGLKNQQ